MQKIEFEYDFWLSISNKWNQVLRLTIYRNEKQISYFGSKVIKVINNKSWIFFLKEDKKQMRKLKELTDNIYLKYEK